MSGGGAARLGGESARLDRIRNGGASVRWGRAQNEGRGGVRDVHGIEEVNTRPSPPHLIDLPARSAIGQVGEILRSMTPLYVLYSCSLMLL